MKMATISADIVSKHPWQPYAIFPIGGELLCPALITALVFCVWPANYFIRETIKYCRVQDCVNRKGEELPPDAFKRSGALIGATERFFVLHEVVR